MNSRLYRDDAVVLRTQELGEADRIVTLYTKRHGKVRAVAKGVRKINSRFGARVEPFQRIDVQLHRGKNLDTVSQVVTISAYAQQIAGDYHSYTCANAMAEAVDRLTNEGFDPTSEHYMMLVGALHALSTKAHSPALILDAFLIRSIASAGWTPSVRDCAVCGAVGPHHAFDIAQGGVVCRSCRVPGAIAARPSVIEHIIFLLAGDWESAERTDPAAQSEAGGLIGKIVAHHLERPLWALDLIDRSITAKE